MIGDPLVSDVDRFGAQLAEAIRRDELRRRRMVRGALAGTAAVAVGLGAFVAVPGAGRLDPVAEARAALGTEGELLHYRVSFEFRPQAVPGEPVPASPRSRPEEVWTTTAGPTRWRIRHARDGCYVGGPVPGMVAPSEETFSAVGRVHRLYSRWSRLIVERTGDRFRPGPGADGPFGPSLVGELGGDDADPTTTLRRALDRGLLRDAGTRTSDGRVVRVLKGEAGGRRLVRGNSSLSLEDEYGRPRRREAGDRIVGRPTRLTYTVDAATFAPIRLEARDWSLMGTNGHSRHGWSTRIVTFDTFERLPASSGRGTLLELSAPAGTEVVRPTRAPEPTGEQPPQRLPRVEPAAQRRAEVAMRRCIEAQAQGDDRSEPTP